MTTKPQTLKELVKGDLTVAELKLMPSSFDVVGDILIFADFPSELSKKEKLIGEKILDAFRNIKVVCKKTRHYTGEYRTPKLKIIAGENRKETIHRENGVQIKLDVEKVYFSTRLGHERERINKLVKEREKVLVMFSGCGVYCINISKNSKANEIYGIEINPEGHKYALENVKINKLKNIQLYLGDVNLVLPKIEQKFDRVLMPLPKSAEDFLDIALSKLKRNGILHFYDFLHENEFGRSEEKVLKACERNNKKCEILNFVKCGQYGTRKYRICVDAKIL